MIVYLSKLLLQPADVGSYDLLQRRGIGLPETVLFDREHIDQLTPTNDKCGICTQDQQRAWSNRRPFFLLPVLPNGLRRSCCPSAFEDQGAIELPQPATCQKYCFAFIRGQEYREGGDRTTGFQEIRAG